MRKQKDKSEILKLENEEFRTNTIIKHVLVSNLGRFYNTNEGTFYDNNCKTKTINTTNDSYFKLDIIIDAFDLNCTKDQIEFIGSNKDYSLNNLKINDIEIEFEDTEYTDLQLKILVLQYSVDFITNDKGKKQNYLKFLYKYITEKYNEIVYNKEQKIIKQKLKEEWLLDKQKRKAEKLLTGKRIRNTSEKTKLRIKQREDLREQKRLEREKLKEEKLLLKKKVVKEVKINKYSKKEKIKKSTERNNKINELINHFKTKKA